MKTAKPFLEFAWRMQLALRMMRTFNPTHPRVAAPLEETHKAFKELVSGKVEVQVVAARGRLLVNEEPLDPAADPNVANLLRQMEERELGGIILGRGLELEELRAWIALLAGPPKTVAAAGGAEALLRKARVRHLQVTTVRYVQVRPGEEEGPVLGLPPVGAVDASAREQRRLEAIRWKLQQMGLPPERLETYLAMLAWEQMDPPSKLRVLEEGEAAFDLAPDSLLNFLRDLLGDRLEEEVRRVLLKVGSGLFSESSRRRQQASELFVAIAQLAREPGLPPLLEKEVFRLLRDHFAQERDPKLQQLACDGLEPLLGYWLQVNELELVHSALKDLGGSALIWVPGAYPWKSESLEGLLHALSSPQNLGRLLPQLYELGREELQKRVYPLLARMGEPAARHVIQALDGETTQTQRGRLIEALRAIGPAAIPPLRKALESPHWHLVRNAINTLRDLGSLEDQEGIARCLQHEDVRVRAAAARALRGMGAAAILLEQLPHVDPDTQVEVLLGLGPLQHEAAVPAMGQMAATRGLGFRRVEAVKALGLVGSPSAVSALVGLLGPKGLLTSQEDLDVLGAAATALVDLHSGPALEAVRVAAEGARGARKTALMGALGGGK